MFISPCDNFDGYSNLAKSHLFPARCGLVPLQVRGKVCSRVLERPQSAALQLCERRTAAACGVERFCWPGMAMADGMIDVQYCMVSEGVTADACNGSGRLRWGVKCATEC